MDRSFSWCARDCARAAEQAQKAARVPQEISSVTSALPAALPVDVRTIEGNRDNVKPVSTSEASDVNTMVTTYCCVVQDTNVEKSETMKVCDAYLWLLRSQLSHEPLLTEHGSLSH